MLDRFYIKNFKAFKEADITIRPITIIVGPNNSGKSSLIQAINLVQQTMLRNASNQIINTGSLGSTGDQLIDFGTFREIINQAVYNSKTLKENDKKIEYKLYFGKNYIHFSLKEDDKAKVYIDNFSLNTSDIEYSLDGLSASDYNEKDFSIKDANKFKINLDKLNIESDFRVKNDDVPFNLKIQPRIYREGFFFYIASVKPDDKWLKTILNEKFSSPLGSNLSLNLKKNSVDDIIKAFLDYTNQNNKISTNSYSFFQKIKGDFARIKYIGPIRQSAEKYYNSGDFSDISNTGEHATQILAQDARLRTKVEKYLKKMDIAESLEINQITDQKIFELKIRTACLEKGINLKYAGCGVPQILPVIIQSLRTMEESLTMIEQPEVHLHPKIQAELADFFIEIASIRHRFLIETHSDYLIERIRYHVAKGDLKSEDVLIYYIEPDPVTKSSRPIEVEINSKGQYHNLPKGYITNFKLTETKNMTDVLLKNLRDK